MAQRYFYAAFALLSSVALVFAAEVGLRERAQEIYSELQKRTTDNSQPIAVRAESAAQISQLRAEPDLLEQLRGRDREAAIILAAEEALRAYRFDEVPALIASLKRIATPEAIRLRYRWWFLTENLRTVDSLTQAQLRTDSSNATTLWARGELLYRLVRYDEAESFFVSALRRGTTSRQQADAKLGLAKVYQKRDEHQRGLDSLLSTMNPEMLTADILLQMGSLLVNLSRVSEAIDLFEEAVRWNPDSEFSHYYLGNGYARLNYTQLREKYPSQFGETAANKSLMPAVNYCASGQWEFAHMTALSSHTQAPNAVEPLSLLGSIAWTCERLDEAADFFRTALDRCPEYGRAHNGLAKALEGKRLRINVHRAEDSLRFASQPMPEIAGIDSFVINWSSLSARHRKQVALAVEPWKLYIPVLVESGHRYYIKPLHERLSESPGLETLKDQRINYDSRLWDDVRGCGGYTTVTGIEDVERSIYANYNTVLHELTHQVHGVFPPEDAQRLTDRYDEARNLEAAGTKVFMSQYQASSVWEYFAEGANGYYSPRRDKYDTREIVCERLFELDTTLAKLVEYYVRAPNLNECYPVGMVNAVDEAIEQQKLDEALLFAQKAYARAPRAEVVLAELSTIYSLRDDDRKAVAFADSLRAHYPQKTRSYLRFKDAQFYADGDAQEAIAHVKSGLGLVDSTEEKTLRQSLGDALWYAGQYAEAAEEYQTILSRHSKDSGALWGLGLALGDAGDYAGADSAFQQALLERSGITELRMDYARILIRAGRLAEAEAQFHEGEILAPKDPQVLTMKGWLAAERGDFDEAIQLYDGAIQSRPHDRLPQLLRVSALHQTGKSKQARKALKLLVKAQQTDVPGWEVNAVKGGYSPTRLWPHFQVELLNRVAENL